MNPIQNHIKLWYYLVGIWAGILDQQYQYSPDPSEVERPALSDHWLNLPLGYRVCLTQKRDGQSHKLIVHAVVNLPTVPVMVFAGAG